MEEKGLFHAVDAPPFRELVIGCGSKRAKIVGTHRSSEYFLNPTFLDINPDHNPDVVHDLRIHPLPFYDNEFDEIHAYEVLEHLAYQGDYEFFFKEFSEYWRILKPDGFLLATVPSVGSIWAWGDPGHKRVIQLESLTFLSQVQYFKQVGITPMTDYRYIYKRDFRVVHFEESKNSLCFVIQAVKP